ncbi:hypothetical protein WNY37_16780 [Henriciella sp. AS95]|uniref:hypothetical protein n=1 Tax=Henriciella sp. AS95 TaxID=3135782 RepID=UPI00317777A1
MADATSEASAQTQRDLSYFATRPNPVLDNVILEADYAARAALSFWRFRQLGGGGPEIKLVKDGEGKLRKIPQRPEVGELTTSGIHYVSDHPEVRIFHLSFIALLVLFESAANAYFFAQQSEFGISGGLFQAAAVSLANVAVSYFIIGFWGLRHVTSPWSWKAPWNWNRLHFRRLFAYAAIFLGLVLVLLVNLSAAHYRNILDLRAEGLASPEVFTSTFPRFPIPAAQCEAILSSDIGQSIGSAATNAMCRPFSLHSLDAMVLFALGIAISCLAAFEGRKSDAAFPGFSDAARQFERARKDLQYALEDYYDTYQDTIGEAGEVLGTEEVEEDGETYRVLSPSQEIELMRMLDAQIEPYRKLLTSDPDLLRDEYAAPSEAVERVTGRKVTIPDRKDAYPSSGNDN